MIEEDLQCYLGTESARSANQSIPSATKHDWKAVHRWKEIQPDTTMAMKPTSCRGSSICPRKSEKNVPKPHRTFILYMNSLININTFLTRLHIYTNPPMFQLHSTNPINLSVHSIPTYIHSLHRPFIPLLHHNGQDDSLVRAIAGCIGAYLTRGSSTPCILHSPQRHVNRATLVRRSERSLQLVWTQWIHDILFAII